MKTAIRPSKQNEKIREADQVSIEVVACKACEAIFLEINSFRNCSVVFYKNTVELQRQF
jgi:hypothetical protein